LTGTFYLAPLFGVKGAAASLLIGELFVAVCSFLMVRRIFGASNMNWPQKQIIITIGAVSFSSLLIVVGCQTEKNEQLVLLAAFACAAIACSFLIMSLPKDLRRLVFRG